MSLKSRFFIFTFYFVICCFGFGLQTQAMDDADITPPPMLADLKNIPKENKIVSSEEGMPFDLRKDAQREAALSYGARGGLARGTYEIRQQLDQKSGYMEKIFDFGQLLIPAPSGLMIEPPIISENIDAMVIQSGGLEAAVADRVYNIGRNARIVSAPRTWRAYLERQWDEVPPPPDILRPENKEERERWKAWVQEGWEQGIGQADDIFQDDLNRLVADFQGMVRYRMLLTQGMVSPPYALQQDRGVTGGGRNMRVGDRAVSLTNLPEFQTRYDQWKPANR